MLVVKYMRIDKGCRIEIRAPAHWNLIGHTMTASPPVIAQQYSSATFFQLRFYSRREKFGLRKVISVFVLFKKLRNLASVYKCIY